MDYCILLVLLMDRGSVGVKGVKDGQRVQNKDVVGGLMNGCVCFLYVSCNMHTVLMPRYDFT